MKLGRNLEISAGDFVRFNSGNIYICIRSTKDDAELMNIVSNKTIMILQGMMYGNDTSGINEIRKGWQTTAGVIFNTHLDKYKHNEITLDELWDKIIQYTNLTWSRKLVELKSKLHVNDIIFTKNEAYLVVSIIETFLGTRKIDIISIDKNKNTAITLIDKFSYSDDIKYYDENNSLDMREIQSVVVLKDDYKNEISKSPIRLKEELRKINFRVSIMNETDKFEFIYDQYQI